ncbi:MAG: purine-binding chemotaxis protein CheW [Spirochaetales bacterium]|nr:purine-binding chemotaxis protein CheW [Spirochaetales bacterium]
MTKTEGITKYLVFSLGSEYYGIPIETVREIIRFEQLTPVHDTQEYIMGVINLRGKIIPVMDLRRKFGLPFREYTDKTVLVILDIPGENGVYQVALSVDAVHEVTTPGDGDMERIPEIGMKLKRDFLTGILKTGGRMTMILEITRIISSDEIIRMEGAKRE